MNMKQSVIALALVGLVASLAFAQDTPSKQLDPRTKSSRTTR
jgi:hypothetical protein